MEGLQNHSENVTPKVLLHFLRHSIKEKASEKSDTDTLISEEGRELAAKKFGDPVDMRFGHVVGSPRMRTQETAAVAATQNPEIYPEELGIGKVRINEALDFVVGDTLYGKRFAEAYKEGRLMSFVVRESDAVAKESGDMTSSTYSRMAANIAGIIYRNFEAASRGAAILEQSQNPKNELNDFERILSTHAGTQESFLLKLVGKIKGEEARDALLSLIGENGFEYVEGFDVTLSKENGKEKIRITYRKDGYIFDEIVPADIIKEIADEV